MVVKGDATEPTGSGVKIVAHVVNDKALTWGAGFGAAIAAKFPKVERSFKAAVLTKELKLSLGSTFATPVARDLHVFQMIAQRGYGERGVTRLSYVALRQCLEDLASWANRHSASIHLPRIGTGYGGGEWAMISELIRTELCERGLKVKIYELPNAKELGKADSAQQTLF
jgi:O-acetyl-ADP-ribose deacetylase (regulator of RNase III)